MEKTASKSEMQISRAWLEKMAKLEEECESISVGGLAVRLGLYNQTGKENNPEYNQQR